MKNNIENSIKESLNNYELEYNSSAWDSLSSKLDAGTTPAGDSNSRVDNAIKSSLKNYELPYAASAWTAMNARLDANPGFGVDQSIKSSLENYELPYAASAWTAMNASLDKKDKPRSNTKWYVAASALIAVSAVSYFVMNGGSEESNLETNNTEIAQNNTDNGNVTNSNSTSNTISTDNAVSNTESNASVVGEPESNQVDPSIAINNAFEGNNNNGNGNGSGNGNGGSDERGGTTGEENGSYVAVIPVLPEVADFVMPSIPSVCQGTSISIANSNKYDMNIVYPNGSIWTGKPQSETTLTAVVAGTYSVGHMSNGQLIEEGTFDVKSAPNADFDFVDLGEILLEGLPTTEVKSTTPGIKYEWKYGKQTSTGTEAAPHFFTKGDHDIELTITGSNGCTNTVTKTVNIEDNYNLLATTGFDPRSLDSRNNTFIPQALIERDVTFTMIIIDINDGHVMYETSDASQGWDGIDRQSGDLIGYQKPFIWKVTIENPEQGERSTYGGSGVAIPKSN